MIVVEKAAELTAKVKEIKQQGLKVGFVPTMGALHMGHISLIKKSIAENDVTIASIFVNPTQFNDKQDLANYPRMLDKDLKILEENGCNLVFAPSEAEMYPETDTRIFDFGNLDKVMEGKHRPGHFNGVAQIVSKLFAVVNPHNAYFGEKDFQQVAIIKKMVAVLNLDVHIVSCPIVRETDGLAMSSRNLLLSKVQREQAPAIYKALNESTKFINSKSVEDVKKFVVEAINNNSELEVEYFDIVNDLSLESITSWTDPGNKAGCIAVKVGKIRLIDNIRYNL